MRWMMGFITLAALGLALTAAQAEDKAPDATLKLSGGSVAGGVGVDWGRATLTYQGEQHPIVVKGLWVVAFKMPMVEASGKVFNLQTLADFNGFYTAVPGTPTAAGGAGMATMKNQNGVTVEIVSTEGVQIGVGGAGVDVTIKE